ncbi:MAG: GIY-YIG nuclease family protein [bacterium]
MFYTYVLHSLSFDCYYVGSTGNLEKRIQEHNSGLSRFTKGRKPWELVYKEEFPTRGEAMKREKFFKSGQGRELIKEKLAHPRSEG